MKTALFVYGGYDFHQPEVFARMVSGWLEELNWKVELSDSLEVFADRQRLSSFDLIVPVWTGGELTGEQEAGLDFAVRSGTGLAGWHGMADAFGNSSIYKMMVGGRFVWHPAEDVKIDVQIKEPDDEIMHGVGNFSLSSELYYMHVDPANQVLANCIYLGDDCVQTKGAGIPIVWKRHWGKGKIFYFSIGHKPEDFKVPLVRQIVQRGLLWASR